MEDDVVSGLKLKSQTSFYMFARLRKTRRMEWPENQKPLSLTSLFCVH